MSGGQRQRLALARALLSDFPILVLDEPGEHLDVTTADKLLAAVLATASSPTAPWSAITHRLQGLEELDEIVINSTGEKWSSGARTKR